MDKVYGSDVNVQIDDDVITLEAGDTIAIHTGSCMTTRLLTPEEIAILFNDGKGLEYPPDAFDPPADKPTIIG